VEGDTSFSCQCLIPKILVTLKLERLEENVVVKLPICQFRLTNFHKIDIFQSEINRRGGADISSFSGEKA